MPWFAQKVATAFFSLSRGVYIGKLLEQMVVAVLQYSSTGVYPVQ
jgi:hypothetical protein